MKLRDGVIVVVVWTRVQRSYGFWCRWMIEISHGPQRLRLRLRGMRETNKQPCQESCSIGDDVRVGKADGGRYSVCSLKAGRYRQDVCRRCQEKERRLLSTYQGQKQAFPSNKTIEIQQRSASCREWGEGAGFKAQGARARGVN